MRPLLLLGGGGHCHSCIDVIETTGIYQIRGIVQPGNSSNLVLGYPVIGSDDCLPALLKQSNLALITVGQINSSETRIHLFHLLTNLGAELPVVISPRAYCSKHTIVGRGSIVMHGAIVNSKVIIGNNCIVNSHALIEHDVTVGDHCHVSTGAKINGNVTIGSGTFIGSGAVIKEGISIGENVVISAGLAVFRNVSSGTVLKNNYA